MRHFEESQFKFSLNRLFIAIFFSGCGMSTHAFPYPSVTHPELCPPFEAPPTITLGFKKFSVSQPPCAVYLFFQVLLSLAVEHYVLLERITDLESVLLWGVFVNHDSSKYCDVIISRSRNEIIRHCSFNDDYYFDKFLFLGIVLCVILFMVGVSVSVQSSVCA